MKTHTVEGERMLQQVGGLLADVGVVVRASHERWDGGGYPDGLARRGDPARRAHRLGLRRLQRDDHRPLLPQGAPLSSAVGELRRRAGTQFDPAVVDALVALVTEAGRPLPSPATRGWQLTRGAPSRRAAGSCACARAAPGRSRRRARELRLGRVVGERPVRSIAVDSAVRRPELDTIARFAAALRASPAALRARDSRQPSRSRLQVGLVARPGDAYELRDSAGRQSWSAPPRRRLPSEIAARNAPAAQ